jgi:hypothetical protein
VYVDSLHDEFENCKSQNNVLEVKNSALEAENNLLKAQLDYFEKLLMKGNTCGQILPMTKEELPQIKRETSEKSDEKLHIKNKESPTR